MAYDELQRIERDARAAAASRQVLFRSVAVGLLVVLISVGGILRRLDRSVLDHRQRVMDRAAAQSTDTRSEHVLIVDAGPDEVDAWQRGVPGRRGDLAWLVSELTARGAGAIVLDFALSAAAPDDEALAKACAAAGNVVLRCELTSREPTQFTLTRPREVFSGSVAAMGFSLWEPYHDAIVRHFLATLEGGVELSLPTAAWAAMHRQPASEVFYSLYHRGRLPGTSLHLEPEQQIPLHFCGPPGEGFITLPYDGRETIVPTLVRGKVVIVGTLSVAQGGWTVPLSTSLRPEWVDRRPLYMSETELTANAVDTLLSRRLVRTLGPIGSLLLAVLFAVGAGFAPRLTDPPVALLSVLAGLIAWYVGTDMLFASSRLNLPLFEPLAAALLSFGLSGYHRLLEQAGRASERAEQAESERARLADLDAAKRIVIGTVAHDMKVPVSIIRGQSITLAEDPDRTLGREVHQEFLQTMAWQCDRLLHQIEDLLDADPSRAVVLQRQSADLNGLIERVVAMHRSSLPLHTIRVKSVGLPPLSLDVEKVERTLDNLISNAIKYSPDGGEVRLEVSLKAAEREVAIAVTDQGIGMTPEQVDRLFGLFVRLVDPGLNIAGSGIGLYSAKRLVTAHGGRIEVRSTPGRGSTFTVLLPLHVTAGTRTF